MANKVHKMAEGQVMMNHNLLVINFSCVVKISLSGEGFWEASMW